MIACLWNRDFLGIFMLVARRDPPFHGYARDIASINIEANPGSKQPRVVRFVTVIQMVGSLLAVPVGIGSAYTFYRANFSPETTCQSLRSGIIAMLDKGVETSRVLKRPAPPLILRRPQRSRPCWQLKNRHRLLPRLRPKLSRATPRRR